MGDSYQIKNQEGIYFFTFQIVGWVDVFSRKVYRDIILESFTYCQQEKSMELFGYVIMTNHLHAIIRSKKGDLSGLIRDFKTFTSKSILKEINQNPQESRKEWMEMVFKYHAKYNKRSKEKQFWTHENHAVELSNEQMISTRLDYIHNNPVETVWVQYPEDYLYSSARNYDDEKGLIELEIA